MGSAPTRRYRHAPTIAQIAGVLLDAVMLDALEVDLEHSERVKTSVLPCRSTDAAEPFRLVEVLWLRLSERVRELAGALVDRILRRPVPPARPRP